MEEITNGLRNLGKLPEDKSFTLKLTFQDIRMLSSVMANAKTHQAYPFDAPELDEFIRNTEEVCDNILARNPVI